LRPAKRLFASVLERCGIRRVEAFLKESTMANKAPKAQQQHRDAKEKESAIIKPMLKTGLPPGISEDQARNPGSTQGGKRVKNNS
jgi:hypothetical protein